MAVSGSIEFPMEASDSDVGATVPSNWPKIDALTRKRSFQVTKAMHTRVHKAQSHLELLQNAIEDWFCDLRQRQRTMFSAGSSSLGSSQGTQLEIVGDGLASYTVPYLGAEEVLDEVILLLARLENERQETEERIVEERQRVKMLAEKIDQLSQLALEEMPLAVQREHEACASDIAELQWHVSYKTKAEAKALKKKNAAENMYKRLVQDIEFVKNHCPLVKEKLDLELESMTKIKEAQDKTATELKSTTTRMEKVEMKHEDANKKATSERTHMAREIKSAKKQLKKAKQNLTDSEKEYEKLVSDIAAAEQRLMEDKQEVEVLRSKNDTCYKHEDLMRTKVAELRRRLQDAQYDEKMLEDDNKQLESELKSTKKYFSEQTKQFELYLHDKQDKLRDLRRQNEELDMETEDMLRKVEECERQKAADEKNCARIKREMENTKEQMASTTTEFNRIANIHRAVKDKLEAEEKKIRDYEEQLRSTVMQLQKQIKDEIHSRTVIQTRIKTDTVDLSKNKEDAEKKKKQMQQMVKEIQKMVKEIRVKVEALRAKLKEKTAITDGLQADLDSQLSAHAQLEAELRGTIADLEPLHAKVKDALVRLMKRLDHMEWQTDLMNKKLEEMLQASNMIKKTGEKVEVAIEEFKLELAEVNIVLKSRQRKEDNLRRNISSVNARNNETQNQHRALMQKREEMAEKLQVELGEALELNADLAGKYRTLQNELFVLKDKFLDTTQARVQFEGEVRDVKQLQKLQQQLYQALILLYDYKNALCKAELEFMEQESTEDSQKVKILQVEMGKAIDFVSAFLGSHMEALTMGERVKTGAFGVREVPLEAN